ncbi:unnamed protein product [Rhodiola kirilowii]
MGVEAQIPVIDFSAENDISRAQVRDALEVHGCFLLRYNKSATISLTDKMFEGMKSLFYLPDDTKRMYKSSKAYCSYNGKNPYLPLFESFGVDYAYNIESAQAFTGLMWPEGNSDFCDAMNGLSTEMLQVNLAMLKVIFESYGVGSSYESFAKNVCAVIRMTKYHVPPSGDAIGLAPHSDTSLLTLLCENAEGLEIMSRDGNWSPVSIPQGCFLVIVGDLLKAWSNGRLHPVKHKVTLGGNKDRYSIVHYTIPEDGVFVEVPKELVDNEHPIKYKPLTYNDYMSYYISNVNKDAAPEDPLEKYAGI